MKMNRAQRRGLVAVARSKETKKTFAKAIGLALKVYGSQEDVNKYLSTTTTGGATPFQDLLYGNGDGIIADLKDKLTQKNKIGALKAEVESASRQVEQILASQSENTVEVTNGDQST